MSKLTWARGLFELSKWFILAVFVLFLFYNFLFSVDIVDGVSMDTTLKDRDVVLVNRLIYRFSEPQRGDIVVLRYPGDPEKTYYVKRVVGLPGEEIKIDQGKVFIDGEELGETYLGASQKTEPPSKSLIAKDSYYTMGDNRLASSDSRKWGYVAKEYIIGKVSVTILPHVEVFSEILY